MTDIAPLGFAINTSGLDKGKRAADDFAKAAMGGATATDKLTQATIAAAKAESEAAQQAARTATAKLNLLRATEGVSAATLKEAQATKQSADAAALAARSKYDLAKAGESVADSLDGVSNRGAVMAGVLQGVSREAAAMASQMGITAGGRLGVAGAMGAAQGAAGRLSPQLLALGGVTGKLTVGVGALATGYLALAASVADNQDRWASYQQQLVNSLGSQGAAQQSLYEVVDLANEVGISVDAALTSFNRFARAKDSIGATNAELVQMTEIILKIGRSSGVDAGAMQGAMMQLSQALASGRLNGDELRSIMENMQPLAGAIADGLGVSVGQLRRMGAEGELTGDKIFKALLGQADKAEEAFASMPKTVEQAKARMANQFDELGANIGRVIEASGVVQSIINTLSSPVEGLNKAFRRAANEGVAEAETKLKQLEARMNKLKQQTGPAAQEFDKQFNKELVKADDLEKQRKDAEARLLVQREQLEGQEKLLLAQAMRVNASRDQILQLIEMGKTRLGFAKGASKKVEALGTEDFLTAEKAVAETRKAVERTQAGLEELRRQEEALKRSDPFEKVVGQAEDLEEALRMGGVSMADTWLQALEISRATGKSIDEVVAALKRLDAAQRALADAKEIRALRTEAEKLAAVTGAIGQGSYAERLAGHQAGIAAFQSERAEMGATGTSGFTISAGGGAGNLPADIVSFFVGRGYTAEQARGIAAGIMSESSGNHNALNRSSGALGLGQWLGSRKRGLLSRFGPNPSRMQQLSYLDYELRGGDAGGRSVLAGGSAADVAARYIRDFMRPGPDTAGGIRRALRHLGGGSVTMGGAGVADMTGDVVAGRNSVFAAQERERAMRLIDQFNTSGTDAVGLAGAAAAGPEALRLEELRLKVLETVQDVAPEYRQMVEDAVTDADAKQRLVDAEKQLYALRQTNDNQARRNAAERTGNPAAMRQLELELRIEEIKRTTPPSRQGAMIDAARRDSDLQLDSALAKRTGELQNQQRAIAEQYKLIGLMGDEERIANRLLDERNALYAMGADLNSQQVQDHLAMVEVLERQNIQLDKALQRWQAIRETGQDTARQIGSAFATAFGEMARTGDVKWKNLMGSIEEAFYSALDRMVQQFIISPLVNFMGNLFTSGLNSLFGGGTSGLNLGPASGFGGPPAANGGAFAAPVTPFALGGGIFNTPTRFRHGRGQGLAGEGPGLYEGILPLKRGADGRLGVAASGGGGSGTQVNVYDMRAAGNSEAIEIEERQTGDGMRQLDIMVRDSVKGHFRKGSFDADQRANFGVGRAVPRR